VANTYIRIGIGLTGSGSGGDTFRVKISSDDNTPAFLEDKIKVGSNKLTKVIENPGADERVVLDISQEFIDTEIELKLEELESSLNSLILNITEGIDENIDSINSNINNINQLIQELNLEITEVEESTLIIIIALKEELELNLQNLKSQIDEIEDMDDNLAQGLSELEDSLLNIIISNKLDTDADLLEVKESLESQVSEIKDNVDLIESNLEDIIISNKLDTDADIVNLENSISTSIESSISEITEATNEPTGFVNRTDSVVTFDDVTFTLSIQPTVDSFDIFIKGNKCTKTSEESVSLDNNLSGNHYFFYNEDGVLIVSNIFTPNIFIENAIVAVVYWNTDLQEHVYFAEERHGLQMDGATHGYLHTTFGARYISGLALENFSNVGGPSLDVSSGSIRDEDLLLQINPSTTSQLGIMYRIGNQWRKDGGLSYPLLYGGSVSSYQGLDLRVPYNEFDEMSQAWALVEADNNNFVLVHYFATNDVETPIVAIQGTQQYNNIPDAKNGAASEINLLSGLPFLEFVSIGTVVYETSNGFTRPSLAEYVEIQPGVDYVDFRGTQPYTPAGTATSHSILSGLANDDHFQYLTEERADIWYQNKFPLEILEQDVTFLDAQTDVNSGIVLTNDMQAVNIEVAIERGTNIEYLQVEAVRTPASLDWAVSTTSLGNNSGVSIDVIGNNIKYTCTSTGINALARIKVNGIGYNIP